MYGMCISEVKIWSSSRCIPEDSLKCIVLEMENSLSRELLFLVYTVLVKSASAMMISTHLFDRQFANRYAIGETLARLADSRMRL